MPRVFTMWTSPHCAGRRCEHGGSTRECDERVAKAGGRIARHARRRRPCFPGSGDPSPWPIRRHRRGSSRPRELTRTPRRSRVRVARASRVCPERSAHVRFAHARLCYSPPNPNGVENNLARYHGYDQDDSGVEHSAQGGAAPFHPGQRCRQPGKNRHIPDRIDRRPDGREIFANLDQQRRHSTSVRESPMTVQSFFYLLLVTASSPSPRD